MVAGARGAARRAARARGPDDLVGRRHRDPAARGRRPARRRSRRCCSPSPTRSRTSSSASWRTRRCSPPASARTRLGRCSCRGAGRGPGRRSGSSASARRTCWRSRRRYGSFPILVETYRECLSDVFDLPALREILGGVARREIAVHGVETVRASPFAGIAAVRLRRGLHVRGRRAARRAPRPGAHARPRPAARAARPGGAARAARSGGAGRPRAEPPGADRRPRGRRRSTRSTTCCAGSATCRRPRSPRGSRAARGRRRTWLAELAAAPARRPDPDRRRRPLDRDRGRRALSRRRRGPAAGRRAGGVPRAGVGRARRAACALRADPRPVPGARAGAPLGAAGRRRRRMRSSGCWPPARSCAASSGRAAPSANGAIPRSSGCCAAARWPGCGARWSRSIRRRSPASCPTGRASPRIGHGAPAAPLARPRSNGSPRWSTSSPGCRSRPRSSSATSCPRGSPATSRACSTSSARWARSPGWGAGSLGRDDGRIAAGPARARDPPRPLGAARRRRSRPAEPRHDAIREHLAARGASFYRELFAAAGGDVRSRGARRAVGPRVGRRGHQRHVRAAPGAALEAVGDGPRRRGGGRAADRLGPARGRRALVARRPEPRPADPPPSGSTPAPRAARPARRPDPRGGRHRGHRGRLRGGLPGAARDGGGRPDPARLLRRWPRRGPVRARRGARPVARGSATRPIRRRRVRSTCSPPPTRPTRTARRSRGRAAARRTDGRSSARPAPTSCSWTASRRSTSSAAGPRSRPCPPPTTRQSRSPRSVPLAALVADGRVRELVIRKVDGEEVGASPFRPLLLEAGFVAGYRGLALRPSADRA